MRVTTMVAVAVLLWSAPVLADSRFDVGLLIGSTRATDEGGVLRFKRATTYQATFDVRVWWSGAVMLGIEVPFIASPAFDVDSNVGSLPNEYASLYLTPGVRATFRAGRPLALFVAGGAGYARYSESKSRLDGSPNPQQRDTNTGAVQFGGGVDVSALNWLGFRGEVRDVFTGARSFSIPTPAPRVHNVVASGGLVIRF
jgi:hypothetical protein